MICQELSDKMPGVARGEVAWDDAEAEHLRACAECRREWVVVTAGVMTASGVGLDPDALADGVLHRLRTEPVARRPPRSRWLVGLAAAAVVVFILMPRHSTAPLPRGPAAPLSGSPAAPLSSGPAAPPLAIDVPGLDGLGVTGLADVLDSFDAGWTETSTSDAPSLDDLDVRELERVERSWEI